MASGMSNLAFADYRREGRDEVHYRVRAFGPDGKSLNLIIVNISPHGMMARCEANLNVGDALRVDLPVIGVKLGDVRWALGGRIGCQFDGAIDLAGYYELIAKLLKH